MRRFVLGLHVLTAIFHIVFAVALDRSLVLLGAVEARWLAPAIAVGLVALLHGRVGLLARDEPRSPWRMLLVEEPYFVHWCATVGGTVLFVPGMVVFAVARWIAPDLRWTIGDVAIVAYGLGLLLSIWGVVVRRRWFRVRTMQLTIPGLGPAFHGYRIAHLSDLHIGSFFPKRAAERWQARTNGLAVDLVAFTGDYVTSGTAFHRDIAAVLSGFSARDGVMAVMGNHDYFGDGEPLITLLREGGVDVLRNEHRTIEREGDRMTIAGVDDVWTRRTDVERALHGRPEDVPLLVLAHDPKLFPQFVRRGAALVLSGHTHWGQVAVPFFATKFNLSTRTFEHHADLYREGESFLYVHPGLGTTGPPVRFGAAPEITVIELRSA